MSVRTATCRCGQVQATCEGEPVRVSVCHCLNCQRRTGSAFSAQARWPVADVAIVGDHKSWEDIGESGHPTHFQFCGTCGSTIGWVNAAYPETMAVPLGAFADPDFTTPGISIFEERKHKWVEITGDIEHD
jgi:hypothetical protein